MSARAADNPTATATAAAAAAATEASETPAERLAAATFLAGFGAASAAAATVFAVSSAEEARTAERALRLAAQERAALELQAAVAERTAYPQSFVLLDGHVCELPAGIDPEFLAALPDSLRKEVILEQLRVQVRRSFISNQKRPIK